MIKEGIMLEQKMHWRRTEGLRVRPADMAWRPCLPEEVQLRNLKCEDLYELSKCYGKKEIARS